MFEFQEPTHVTLLTFHSHWFCLPFPLQRITMSDEYPDESLLFCDGCAPPIFDIPPPPRPPWLEDLDDCNDNRYILNFVKAEATIWNWFSLFNCDIWYKLRSQVSCSKGGHYAICLHFCLFTFFRGEHQSLSAWLDSMETCDNTIILDPTSYFEDTFHSIAIIVVCSIILVIMMLVIGVFLFKWVLVLYVESKQKHVVS